MLQFVFVMASLLFLIHCRFSDFQSVGLSSDFLELRNDLTIKETEHCRCDSGHSNLFNTKSAEASPSLKFEIIKALGFFVVFIEYLFPWKYQTMKICNLKRVLKPRASIWNKEKGSCHSDKGPSGHKSIFLLTFYFEIFTILICYRSKSGYLKVISLYSTFDWFFVTYARIQDLKGLEVLNFDLK